MIGQGKVRAIRWPQPFIHMLQRSLSLGTLPFNPSTGYIYTLDKSSPRKIIKSWGLSPFDANPSPDLE